MENIEKCDICKKEIKRNHLGIKSFLIYQLDIRRYSDQGYVWPGNEIISPIRIKVCSNCNQNEKILEKFKELLCISI